MVVDFQGSYNILDFGGCQEPCFTVGEQSIHGSHAFGKRFGKPSPDSGFPVFNQVPTWVPTVVVVSRWSFWSWNHQKGTKGYWVKKITKNQEGERENSEPAFIEQQWKTSI